MSAFSVLERIRFNFIDQLLACQNALRLFCPESKQSWRKHGNQSRDQQPDTDNQQEEHQEAALDLAFQFFHSLSFQAHASKKLVRVSGKLSKARHHAGSFQSSIFLNY